MAWFLFLLLGGFEPALYEGFCAEKSWVSDEMDPTFGCFYEMSCSRKGKLTLRIFLCRVFHSSRFLLARWSTAQWRCGLCQHSFIGRKIALIHISFCGLLRPLSMSHQVLFSMTRQKMTYFFSFTTLGFFCCLLNHNDL